MSPEQLPPFAPRPATPVEAPPVQPQLPAGRQVRPRKAKDPAKVANGRAGGKASATGNKGATARNAKTRKVGKMKELAMGYGKDMPAKRTRRSHVAPLAMDAVTALSVVNSLARKEVQAMQELIGMLNPLARPARKRVLEAVAAILGK